MQSDIFKSASLPHLGIGLNPKISWPDIVNNNLVIWGSTPKIDDFLPLKPSYRLTLG